MRWFSTAWSAPEASRQAPDTFENSSRRSRSRDMIWNVVPFMNPALMTWLPAYPLAVRSSKQRASQFQLLVFFWFAVGSTDDSCTDMSASEVTLLGHVSHVSHVSNFEKVGGRKNCHFRPAQVFRWYGFIIACPSLRCVVANCVVYHRQMVGTVDVVTCLPLMMTPGTCFDLLLSLAANLSS